LRDVRSAQRTAHGARPFLSLAAALAAATGCFASAGLHDRAVEHNREGIARLAEGDFESAAAAFRLALEYNDRFSEPYNNLALVAIRNGDLDGAERLLRQALRLNQDFAEAWTNLGAVQLRRGDPEQAVTALLEAVRIDPGQLDARYDLVLALLETKQFAAAWEQALRLDVASPDDPAVLGLVGWVAVGLGRTEEALGWATRAMAVEPGEPLANLAAGTVLLLRGQAAEAEPYLRAATAADLGPTPWCQLGIALLALGRWEKARAALERALETRPDMLPALVGAGAAAAASGDVVGAKRFLARALELDAEGEERLTDVQRESATRLLEEIQSAE
jgi:Flp pilus assembly protein TadD